MATIIDSLLITLGLGTKPLETGMKRAEGIISTGTRNIIGNILTPLAGAFAFGALIKNFISTGTALNNLSESLGINIEQMQAWGNATSHEGGSAEALQSTLKNLNQQMVELTTFGNGAIAMPLAQLGISARDSNGKVKDSVTILQELSHSADKMDKQKFTALAKKLGVDDGTVRLLQKGSKSVNELLKAQKELGVYSKEDAALAKKANDTWLNLQQALKGITPIFLKLIIPLFTQVSEKITKLTKLLKENEQFIRVLGVTFATVITAMMIPSIVKLGIAMLSNPLTWIFIAIAAAVLLVSLAIDDLITYINGGESALSGLWSMFGTGEEVGKKLAELWEMLKVIATRYFEYTINKIKIVIGIVGSLLSFIWNLIKYFKALFSLDFNGMQEATEKILNSILGIFAGVGKLILNFLDFIGLKEPLLIAWEAIKTWFISFFDWVIDKFNSLLELPSKVKDKVKGFFGDIGDGVMNFLGVSGATPQDAVAPSSINNSRSNNIQTDTKINVGSVTVQTAATDARGIANLIPNAIAGSFNQSLLVPVNSGVVQK